MKKNISQPFDFTDKFSNNKRLIQNTFILYVRMIFTMLLTFFTTRLILNKLGIEDYGLTNIIGSVVAMFGFISNSMTSATSRYLNVYLGKNDFTELKNVFNQSQAIYGISILSLFFLGETLGLYMFFHVLEIPTGKLNASLWFYQFSLFAFLVEVLILPYRSLVIAHENMRSFAWMSVMEGSLCFVTALMLYIIPVDSFVLYGIFIFGIKICLFCAYYFLCHKHYPESRFSWYWEKKLCRELVVWGCWNLWGALSALFSNVLLNVLLNNFFGATVNAARGIAMQIAVSISNFNQNFLKATNPQIIKYYVTNDKTEAFILTQRTSRIGFFLLYFFALPAWLEMENVLLWWLDNVPNHTLIFARLILLQLIIDCVSYPLQVLAMASARIALYQSVVGMTLWLTFPFCYIAFKFGAPPEAAFIVSIGISILSLVMRIILIKKCAGMPAKYFILKALFPSFICAILAAVSPALLQYHLEPGVAEFFAVCSLCVISTLLTFWLIGINRQERITVKRFISAKISKYI